MQYVKLKSKVKVQEKAQPGQYNSQISVISLLLVRF